MFQSLSGPKFPPGRIVITANAAQHLTNVDIATALRRHLRGDWGELTDDDKQANERSLLGDCRLLSAYQTEAGVRFWVITEWDRSVTTLLLPEDY